jgi:hypothetical protein
MAKPRSAAQANGMRNMEDAIFHALTARGVDLRDHSFCWSVESSAVQHTDVHQLALRLRDGRVIIHRFTIEEIDRAADGVIDLAMLRRVQSIAETVSPAPIRH